MKEKNKNLTAWPGRIVLILLLPLIIPLLMCIGVLYLFASIFIYLAVWLWWNSRGIRLFYVYSNSPHWKGHIENEILPRLPEGQIILNWSEKKRWKNMSLASMVFLHFGGQREFNPMALIFNPFRRAKVYRFYRPFQEFKHGKPDALTKLEAEFLQELNKKAANRVAGGD
jgi:hypothetical protein